ncbi:MAG: adenylyl-sulfate kinase [Anaerolineaceae bacterium]|nr:adenylyl-sulfate kinase [Anaerolineaceae bacterium]
MTKNKNIIPHQHKITVIDRSKIKNHQPVVLWFTGLSGSGKSTIAGAVEQQLNQHYRVHTYLLDGDNIRTGLNQDLDFSEQGRQENIRRIGEVSKLMVDAGLIVITAFISPFINDRERVRATLPQGCFYEIFVDCPIEVCESRDPKGLYQKARSGEIPQFTGISSPYEPPVNPELILKSAELTIEECANQVIEHLLQKKVITPYTN